MEEYDPSLIQALSRQKEGIDTEVKFQLQSEDIIIEIEHLLRGDEYDEENNKWHNIPENRHMNELGIKRVSSVLKSHLNKNDFLSKYEEERILKKCKLCVYNLAELFVNEGDKYEMKMEEYDLLLWQIIMPNVESAIRRATESMTFNGISNMHATIEHIQRGKDTNQEIPESKSWKFWGR